VCVVAKNPGSIRGTPRASFNGKSNTGASFSPTTSNFPCQFHSINKPHTFIRLLLMLCSLLYKGINIVSGYMFCTSLWEISSLVINTCQIYQSLNDYYEVARRLWIFQRAMDVILGHVISISLQYSVTFLKDALKIR
jgi:hypothetical protein